MTSARVAIVGAAECDLGVTNKSVLELQTQAVTRALSDAGLSLSDVDGFATNNVSRFSTTTMADYLGLRPAWVDSSFVGGSAFESYVGRAVQAIESGQANVVVVSYASNQRSAKSRSLGGVFEEHLPEAQFETPYGPLYPLSYYAMAAQAYFDRFSVTREQLAEVAIAAREWALLNPKAFQYDSGPLSVDDVVSAPMISTPLTAADCCLVTDGGGAIVLTSGDRARDSSTTPVQVLGYGESTGHASMASRDDILDTGAKRAADAAYARAGLTAADVDVVQVYDSFTITALLSLEALGFCQPGEAGSLAAEGKLRPGGSLPFNTSGGGLSYCHPGQYGILLLIEAVRQLRGECGERQVADAKVAVAHGTGGILSHHSTVLLGVKQ